MIVPREGSYDEDPSTRYSHYNWCNFFYLCTYVVKETDQVILTQFGKPVGEPVTVAGLHFRLPFIQEVNRIEKRFSSLGRSSQ